MCINCKPPYNVDTKDELAKTCKYKTGISIRRTGEVVALHNKLAPLHQRANTQF